jgi:uncharacterized membrane protein
MFFSPLIFFMMLFFVMSLVVLFFVVQIGAISYAFDKIGVPSQYMFSLLLLSWFGSWVNIPIARLHSAEPLYEEMRVSVFGQRYVIPRRRRQHETVLAVNLGGAVIPTLLSLYLFLTRSHAPVRVLIATAAVAAVRSLAKIICPFLFLMCYDWLYAEPNKRGYCSKISHFEAALG